jgi:hypothetical protein
MESVEYDSRKSNVTAMTFSENISVKITISNKKVTKAT